jgi:TolB protein
MTTAADPSFVGAIAYTSYDPDVPRHPDSGAGRSVIFRIDTDGSSRRQLTSVESYGPAWSPDGTTIAYVRASDRSLRLMDADGTHKRNSGATFSGYDAPTWAPDNRRLSYRCTNRGALCVHDLDTRTTQVIVPRTSDWPSVDEPAWSPDGNWIAFTRTSNDGDDYTSYRQIFLVRPDGTDLTPIPNTNPNGTEPGWAPDGQQLIFTDRYDGRGGGDGSLYTIRPDGTDLAELPLTNFDAGNGAYSSDGSLLAYTARGNNGADLWIAATDFTDSQLLVREAWQVTWKPGVDIPISPGPVPTSARGRRIAYLASTGTGYDIFTIRPDGTGLRQVTAAGTGGPPAWSPDHTQLAYTSGLELWVTAGDGTNQRMVGAITNEAYTIYDPAWSPDGREIVVARDDQLIVFDVATGERRRLRAGPGYFNQSPTWSPNGRRIAFSSYFESRPYGADIALVSPHGGTVQRLRLPRDQTEPDWSANGRLVFTQVRFPVSGPGQYQVATATPRGTDVRVLRDTPQVDSLPSWSPAGTAVALYSDGPAPFGNRPKPGLWTVRRNGTEAHWLVRDRTVIATDW